MAIGQHVAKYLAEKMAGADDSVIVEDAEAPAPAPRPAKPDQAVSRADFLEAVKLLLQDVRNADSTDSKERFALEAERLLLEQERLKREMPENKQAPGISAYSYPEGELIRPKPPLKCKMYWVGYELRSDTITPDEIELLNRLEPGAFKVTKSDGSLIPFTVSAKHNDRFQLEELAIWFPCKNEHRHNHGSMTSYLQQALGEHIPTADELLAELQRLKAELARERAGVQGTVA